MLAGAKTDKSCNMETGRDTVSKLHIYICISGGLGGLPWGCKGFLYGFGQNFIHLPGSYTAHLYGQDSCDYTCSQSLRMIHNDLRKSHHIIPQLNKVALCTMQEGGGGVVQGYETCVSCAFG